MTTVCQVYDEATATVLFDLNDPTAANVGANGYSSTQLFQTVDLGSPTFEHERFSPPQRDGGITTFKRAGFRTVILPFRMRAASIDALLAAMGRLNAYLTQGCVLRWRMDGATEYRYADVEPSSSSYFVDGRELSLHLASTLVDTPDGIVITLTAQPYLRGDALDSASNKLINATMTRDADGAGTPDGWVWVATTGITAQNIDVAAEAHEFTIADAAARNLQQTSGAATAASGDIWTFSFDARSPSAGSQVQAVIRYNSSAPADLGSDFTGTLTTLTSGWQRLSVTTTAAPATTDRVKVSLRVDNADATSRDIQWKNAKLEEAAVATPFVVGSEAGSADPAPTTGMGQIFPLYNPGDAPAPVSLTYSNPASVTQSFVGAVSNPGSVPGRGRLTTLLNGGSLQQLEDWTNGSDTVVNTSADSSPGSGNTGKKTTFVTTTDQTRLSRAITTGLEQLAGRTFMLQLRLTAADSTYTGVVYMRYSWGGDTASTLTSPITFTALPTGSTYSYVPMGLASFPSVVPDELSLSISASRTAGTGNVIWDEVMLVPAEEGYAELNNGSSGVPTDLIVTDPEGGRAYTVTSAGLYSRYTAVAGPIPFVAPPGLSLVYMMAGVQSVISSETALRAPRTNTLSMRMLLSPRYH